MAFEYFRRTGFPYPSCPAHIGAQEIQKLSAHPEPEKTGLGVAFANSFHPHRYGARIDGMKTVIEAFNDDVLLLKAIRHALSDPGRLLTGEKLLSKLVVVSGTQGVSNFRPGVASHYYRRFLPPGGTTLDCSAGYGGRLVGFLASSGGRYIGIDPMTKTFAGNVSLTQSLRQDDRVDLYCHPAEDTPDDVEWMGSVDFCFTSPPYVSKERYSDEATQSWVRYSSPPAWRQGFLVPLMRLSYKALRLGGFAAINVADVSIRGDRVPLVEWVREDGAMAGLHLVGEEYLVLGKNAARYGKASGEAGQREKAHEVVLIFQKMW
jgi:hypothetical protein